MIAIYICVVCLRNMWILFCSGTLLFSEVLDMGGPKEIAAIRDLQKEIQFDEPINIQFTSVSLLISV